MLVAEKASQDILEDNKGGSKADDEDMPSIPF